MRIVNLNCCVPLPPVGSARSGDTKKQISTLCSETDRVVRIRLLKSWGKMKDIQLLYLENPAAFKKKKTVCKTVFNL